MKKLVLSFIVIILPFMLFSQNDFLDQFELKRVTADFFGVSGQDNIILAYGNGGIILRSSDKGENWEQIQLDDKYNIMDMIKYGYYYAVLNRDYIIKSYDDGLTWEWHKIGNYKFHKIRAYKNSLYCLSKEKIIVLNTRLEKIKEYNIEVGKINDNPIKSVGDQYDFVILDDKIYYVSDTTEITEINLMNDKTRKLNLEEFGSIDEKYITVPSGLFIFNSKLHFSLSNTLYSFYNDELNFVFKSSKIGIWTVHNENIYNLNRIIFYTENKDSINFLQINQNYSSKKINKEPYDRYISNTKFKAMKFLDSLTIVAVGKDKLIYMSYDGGKNWVLKSHMSTNRQSPIFRNEAKNAMYVSKYVKFVHSTDNGTTWLPQKTYLPYFVSHSRFGNLQNYGNSTFFKGNGVAFYEGFYVENEDTNFIISQSNGDVIKLINNGEISGYFSTQQYKSNFFTNRDRLLMYHSSRIGSMGWYFGFVFLFDDNFRMKRLSFIDSANIIFMDTFFEQDEIYALIINYLNPEQGTGHIKLYDVYFSLIKSIDGGKTFSKVMDFDIIDDKIDDLTITLERPSRSKSEIFFYFRDKEADQFLIYALDIKSLKLSKIGKVPRDFAFSSYGVVKVSSKYYHQCVRFLPPPQKEIILKLYENEDPYNNPDEWKDITPKERYSAFSIVRSNDSLFYISAYDSLAESTVVWFGKEKNITEVKTIIETEPSIYISEPIPNPASDIVRFNVSHDLNYLFEQATIKVYDILGNVISADDEFTVTRRNNHSSNIVWNVSGISPGVYFITVRLGGETMSKPIVIYR